VATIQREPYPAQITALAEGMRAAGHDTFFLSKIDKNGRIISDDEVKATKTAVARALNAAGNVAPEGAPLFSVEPEERPSFYETERAYGGRTAYDRAKKAGRTKLNYRQWVQVRTPEFKAWFGDWEAARGVKKLESMTPMNLNDTKPAEDQKAVEAIFREFSPVRNEEDGRSITFPVSMAGKIVRHKGFNMKRIASAFDRLFTASTPMNSEVEEHKEGHKAHPEIAAYHNYVSKFNLDGKTYYVRFTVQEMKGRQGNLAHSSFVSEVSVYEQGANSESAGVRVIDPVLTESVAPLDRKLAQWLGKGKAPVSKVTDTETGEPMVVYHGTYADSLSFGDLANLNKAGVYRVVAHGGGSVYSAMRGEHIRRLDKIWEAVREAMSIQHILMSRYGLNLDRWETHLRNLALGRTGIIQYKAVLDAARTKFYGENKERLDAIVDALVSAIKRVEE
jgi:hypothetical protein